MSMINRLVRAFETLSTVELDGKDRGGEIGEDYAESIIDDGEDGSYLRNPILPHPRKPGYFLETDFLVYAHGALFCVEIKNYRGRVYYPATYNTVYVKKGWFIFKWTVSQTVVTGYDRSKIIQEKQGHNGEGMVKREQPDPLTKTQRYAQDMQHYLQRLDKRFANVPIYSAVGFSEKTDIKAIYDFQMGIMHISELPRFFEKHKNPAIAKSSAAWITQALHKLPTWDRVWTTDNEMMYGTITDQVFSFKETNGHQQAIPYRKIQMLEFKRAGTFSAYDDLTVTYVDGKYNTFHCAGGEIHLNRFQGEKQVHKVRNLTRVLIGVANKDV